MRTRAERRAKAQRIKAKIDLAFQDQLAREKFWSENLSGWRSRIKTDKDNAIWYRRYRRNEGKPYYGTDKTFRKGCQCWMCIGRPDTGAKEKARLDAEFREWERGEYIGIDEISMPMEAKQDWREDLLD